MAVRGDGVQALKEPLLLEQDVWAYMDKLFSRSHDLSRFVFLIGKMGLIQQ